ncbi:MAG: sigma-70 family RNA polymerase sigma factor, partial [Verrucomicrobiota bacterium]
VPGTSFLKWVCVIARFKTLSFRRKMARERVAFNTELMELMAEEALDESEQRSQEYQALEGCLAKLPEKQRRWVTLAYTQGASARDEAERLGVKEGTFYMRLNRIRGVLLNCIQETLEEKPV